jgi:hypothetical protein
MGEVASRPECGRDLAEGMSEKAPQIGVLLFAIQLRL